MPTVLGPVVHKNVAIVRDFTQPKPRVFLFALLFVLFYHVFDTVCKGRKNSEKIGDRAKKRDIDRRSSQ